MREILKVFRFELSQKLKEKSFYITMIIISLIVLLLTALPAIIDTFKGDDSNNSYVEESEIDKESSEGETIPLNKLGVVIDGEISDTLLPELEKGYQVIEYNNLDELKEAVESEKIDEGAVIKNDIEATVYNKNSNALGDVNSDFDTLMKNNYKYNIELKDYNIPREDLEKIDSFTPNINYESLGKSNIASYILSYASIMFMYFMILIQGQLIATSVAREKDNRTMELLITAVKPKSLIWGKVLAGVVTSLITFLAIVVSGLIGFSITLMKDPNLLNFLKSMNFNIGFMDLAVFTIFLLLGVTLYYLLYAAIGSLVSKLDELNQALTPVTIPIIVAFMLPMMSLSAPNSQLMKIISYVPFTSPLAMFVRYEMADVTGLQLLISIGILLISVILLSILATKIYRAGTLNYGNKMNIFKALKSDKE